MKKVNTIVYKGDIMKILTILMMLILTTNSYASGTHKHGKGGHSHSYAKKITKSQAQEKGLFHVRRLVKSNKIKASWQEATFVNAEQKVFGKKKEWVVTFSNEKGVKGKVIYIFLNLSGKFVAANFTGK